MNYYKNPTTGVIYAYTDEQVEEGIVVEGLVEMTPEEVEAHLHPVIPNSQLLKEALTSLSLKYQTDIEVLNRAWLSAAVNDGVNETSKKDAVLTQITARKATYATERAEIIATYPV